VLSASEDFDIRGKISESEARQSFLLSLNDGLRPLLDAEEIQYQAAKALGEYLHTERVGYAEADGDSIVITRNFTNGVRGIEGVYRHANFGPHDLPSFEAGRTVVRPDALDDPALTPSDRAARMSIDARSSVTVPLLKNGKLVALLFVHQRSPREWTPDEVELVEEVAERIWSAVVRARAENALRASEARLQVALDIAGLGTWEIDLLTGSGAIDERGARIVGMKAGQIPDVLSAQAANVHPDDLKKLRDAVTAAVQRGGIFDLSYRVIDGNETRRIASRGRASPTMQEEQCASLERIAM